MNQQEINKFLTDKVFGECWHENTKIPFTCSGLPNYDFFTNEGCMTLWLKIQEKDWFTKFIMTIAANHPNQTWIEALIYSLHPDHLAPAVYDYLQETDYEPTKR